MEHIETFPMRAIVFYLEPGFSSGMGRWLNGPGVSVIFSLFLLLPGKPPLESPPTHRESEFASSLGRWPSLPPQLPSHYLDISLCALHPSQPTPHFLL
jgi:hypothetical protein